MVLLVPISAEVANNIRTRFWPAFCVVSALVIIFLFTRHIAVEDNQFIDNLDLKQTSIEVLAKRPLLQVAPAKETWDFQRLILSNFIHASVLHLIMNCIGAFAGFLICSTFLPFLCTFSIFLLGGSLGTGISLLVSNHAYSYIPHLGSSAGIFALMGTYYIYNFKYRTIYFFWLPKKFGKIALKTSWFFYLDILLLELLLSLTQTFSKTPDPIDHAAHVIGFFCGMSLAYLLKRVQGWPSYLQSRDEFLFWKKNYSKQSQLEPYYFQALKILEINAYNDSMKTILFTTLPLNQLPEETLNEFFKYLTPTFIRLYPLIAIQLLKNLSLAEKEIPLSWLSKVPYDSIIKISMNLTLGDEDRKILYFLINSYLQANPSNLKVKFRMEQLLLKLKPDVSPALNKDQVVG